jgi:hypothetical protein
MRETNRTISARTAYEEGRESIGAGILAVVAYLSLDSTLSHCERI